MPNKRNQQHEANKHIAQAEVYARPSAAYWKVAREASPRGKKLSVLESDEISSEVAYYRSEERRVGKECRSRW